MSTTGARSSTPSVSGHTTTTSGDSGVAKPDLYHGERAKLNDWLTQMQLYLSLSKVDTNPKKHVLIAITYMRGNAQKWINPYLQVYLEGDTKENHAEYEGTKAWMESFPNFKKEVGKILGPSNEDKVAIRIVQHLQQRTSASDYAAKFKRYSVQTGWDDEALMTMFRRGLKDRVKDKMAFDGQRVDDLDELITQAIEIDDKLYELDMEKQFNGGKRGIAGLSSGQPRGPRFQTKKHQDPYGPMPMELDLTSRKGSGNKQRGNKRGTMKCYACGKPGHMARNCRSKNKVQRPQLNVLTRTEGLVVGFEDAHILDDGVSDSWEEVEPSSPASWDLEKTEDPGIKPKPLRLQGEKNDDSSQDELPSTWPSHRRKQRGTRGHDTHLTTTTILQRPRLTRDERILQWQQKQEQDTQDNFHITTDQMWAGVKDNNPEMHQSLMIRNELVHGYLPGIESTQPVSIERTRVMRTEQLGEIARNGGTKELPCFEQFYKREYYREYKARYGAGARQMDPNLFPEEQESTVREDYRRDVRHPEHVKLRPECCPEISKCGTHFKSEYTKGTEGTPSWCHWLWSACTRDACPFHLHDKRERGVFPGHTGAWHEAFKMIQANSYLNCGMSHWRYCLIDDCTNHEAAKRENGFFGREPKN